MHGSDPDTGSQDHILHAAAEIQCRKPLLHPLTLDPHRQAGVRQQQNKLLAAKSRPRRRGPELEAHPQ